MSAAILLTLAALIVATNGFVRLLEVRTLMRRFPHLWPLAVLTTLFYGVVSIFLVSAAVHCVSVC